MSQRSSDVPLKDAPKLRFGDVTFDPGRRLVLRGTRPVHLEPRAFRLLELLLSRRPRALSKAEILETVWPDVVVTEGSLSALVKDLRKALGEDARSPSYVRTVFGYGYAFEGTVHEVVSAAPSAERHALVWGGTEVRLSDGPNLIGREPPAAIVIPHPSVSREHARIEVEGDRALLVDLGSKNGTFRGGARVEAPTPLVDGDELRLGAVRLTYRGPAACGPADTETWG
jgi:DNA-binding winged helix-turn-helix (wHTH) protein